MSNWKAAHVAHLAAARAPHPAAGTSVPVGADEAVAVPKKRKAVKHEEDALQQAFVTWFDLQYPEYGPLLFAVPNGGKRPTRTNAKTGRTYSPEAQRMRAGGVRSGVADLILAVPTNSAPALFLEMKAPGGTLSDAQKDFLARVKAQGYATAVAYSFDAARDAVRAHLGY